jgi:hypothetical protein
MRRVSGLVAVIALVASMLGFTVSVSAPAFAELRDGTCESGEFCYYYNSGNEGSVSDFTHSVADYGVSQPACYDFKSSGSGQGTCIKNEAASVWNRTASTVRVYFNSNYSGQYQDIPAGQKAQLNSILKNNNASHQILTATGGGARDGICNDGEFCYFYNSNVLGSVSDFDASVGNYGTSQPTCFDFKSDATGQGACIKNEAASVWNRSDRTVRVYFHSEFEGVYQDIPPDYADNLNSTLYNNNASHEFRWNRGEGSARNGVCEGGELCYYYNSNHAGSVSDFDGPVLNYGNSQPSCYEFKGPGNGQGECIKNNAASVWNRSERTFCVYYNSNYGGVSQKIAPGEKVQLDSLLYNNNASHGWQVDRDQCAGSPGGTGGTRDEKVERVISAGMSQVGQGLMYAWGGGGPQGPSYGIGPSPSGAPDSETYGFDCSGLMQYAFWAGAGLDIGPTTHFQQHSGTIIPWSEMRRGDLIFWGTPGSLTTHVALYLGNNELLESSPTTPDGEIVGPYGRNELNIHVREVHGGDFVVRVNFG